MDEEMFRISFHPLPNIIQIIIAYVEISTPEQNLNEATYTQQHPQYEPNIKTWNNDKPLRIHFIRFSLIVCYFSVSPTIVSALPNVQRSLIHSILIRSEFVQFTGNIFILLGPKVEGLVDSTEKFTKA